MPRRAHDPEAHDVDALVAAAAPADPLGEALGLAKALARFGEGEGTVRVGAYEVLERRGAGGHGVVYRARQPSVGGRAVALKLLHPTLVRRGGELERLRHEAATLARLDHPNVVTVHDVLDTPYGAAMVMEYVDGESLGQWQARAQPDWRELVDAYAQLAEALAAAHAVGILHLDVKPSNAMRCSDGRVRVLDFGIAGGPGAGGDGSRDDVDHDHAAGGWTLGYAPPEQIARRPVDARADQFAFCAALWEALYGVLPFAPREIRALADGAVDLRPHPGNLRGPRAIAKALRRGLSAMPGDRWPDLGALVAVLRRAPWRRRPGAWGLAGVALAGVPLTLLRLAADDGACDDPRRALARVWNDDVRAQTDAALARVTPQRDGTLRDTLTGAIASHADAWVAATDAMCRGAIAQGAMGGTMQLEQAACLSRQLDQLDGFVQVLAEATPETVAHAPELLAELGTPGDCVAPTPPEGTAVVDAELLAEIDRGRMLLAAGRIGEALGIADRGVVRAQQRREPQAIAEARMLRGMALSQSGRVDLARDELLAAVADAVALGRDRAAAEGWRRLAWFAADQLQDPQRALEWIRMSAALLDRLGRPPRLVAEHYDALGRIEMMRGDAAAAAQAHETALGALEQALPPGDLRFATTLTGLAHARAQLQLFDDAARLYERALALLVAGVGHEHPRVADLLLSRGLLAKDRGDVDAAARDFADAQAVLESCCGDDAPGLSAILTARAELMTAPTQLDEGERLAERAWELQQRYLPRGHSDRGGALGVLVNLAVVRGDPARALAANLRLAEELRTHEGADESVATIENNIGWYLCRLGRCAEARMHHERVLAMEGLSEALRVQAERGVGETELAAGEFARASARLEPVLQRALQLPEPDPGLVAEIRWQLAAALAGQGRDPERVRSLARAAQAHYREAPDEFAEAGIDRLLRDTPQTNDSVHP
ncbi:MAG: serine/threonine protein kinase [Nannocystaceae bacterium]|nr:serine/threonine protein kinase [Nannocystaceae bacterium]